MLFPALEEASNSEAIRFGERALTYSDLRGVVGNLARQLEGVERVAVWALRHLSRRATRDRAGRPTRPASCHDR
jgi:malonyl-CoA/methylmalonyl-CoA synthetase